VRALADLFPRRICPRAHARFTVVLADAVGHVHQSRRVAHRQRAEEQGGENREDGGVRADDEGERQYRHECDNRRGGERANRHAQITSDVIDQPYAERVAVLLFDLIEAAERETCPAYSVVVIESGVAIGFVQTQ